MTTTLTTGGKEPQSLSQRVKNKASHLLTNIVRITLFNLAYLDLEESKTLLKNSFCVVNVLAHHIVTMLLFSGEKEQW